MNREIVPFTTEEAWLAERRKDLTSTDIATLFGLTGSPFALWHRKHRGAPDVIEETEEMRWGKRLEKSIGEGLAEDNALEVRPMKEYVRLPEYRLGSSFDFVEVNRAFVFEIKDVSQFAFRDQFRDEDFGIECPDRIELQVATQMLVSGIPRAKIGVLVGRRGLIIDRQEYEDVSAGILAKVSAFWKSTEPEPDFYRDADFIAKALCGYAEPGKLIEATPEVEALAREYIGHATAKSQAEKAMAATKARILREIGDAERVLSPEFTLSAKVVKGGHVEYDRGEYRGFRIFAKGEKS